MLAMDCLLLSVSVAQRVSIKARRPAVDSLLVQPVQHVAAPVADGTADAEAVWAGTQVSPVAKGGHGRTYQGGGFVDGQQFVVGVDGVGDVLCHGVLLGEVIDTPEGRGAVRERPNDGRFLVAADFDQIDAGNSGPSETI